VPALRFDPAVPLVMNGASSRTILVAPIDSRSHVGPVVKRLIQTATSRGLTATLLDLSGDAFLNGFDAHTTVARLEGDYDLVVVSLPGIVSDAAVATMRAGRPVLLVTPGRRINRSRLNGAVELLRRLDVPCAGVVMSGEGGNGVVG